MIMIMIIMIIVMIIMMMIILLLLLIIIMITFLLCEPLPRKPAAETAIQSQIWCFGS